MHCKSKFNYLNLNKYSLQKKVDTINFLFPQTKPQGGS